MGVDRLATVFRTSTREVVLLNACKKRVIVLLKLTKLEEVSSSNGGLISEQVNSNITQGGFQEHRHFLKIVFLF